MRVATTGILPDKRMESAAYTPRSKDKTGEHTSLSGATRQRHKHLVQAKLTTHVAGEQNSTVGIPLHSYKVK